MQTSIPQQKEATKNSVATDGKTTTNPLQRKIVEEEEPIQMKQNPFQLKKSTQNPLQLKQPANSPLQFQGNDTHPIQKVNGKTKQANNKKDKNKKEKTKPKNNSNAQEDLIKKAFNEALETEPTVMGSGGAGADVSAFDDRNIWISEAKGKGNTWMSADNIDKKGNVSSKQIMARLTGFFSKKIKLDSHMNEKKSNEKISLKDYILDADQYEHGYQNLLLGSTGMDIDDMLLGIDVNADKDERNIGAGKDDYFPLSVSAVIRFIEGEMEINPGLDQYKNEFNAIKDSWKDSDGNSRTWFTESPKEAHGLEKIYSEARKLKEHVIGHGTSSNKLDKNEYNSTRLLPVINTDKYLNNGQLSGMKVTQQKTGNNHNAPIQFIKFKDDNATLAWLEKILTDNWNQLPKKDKLNNFLENKLKNDNTYKDSVPYNLGRAIKLYDQALSKIKNEKETKEMGDPLRKLDKDQIRHIFEGEVNNKKITGGHWKTGCVKNGFTITVTKKRPNGFYEGTLSHPEAKEEKDSSFYPDSWTKEDIINAIEYAQQPNKQQPYLFTQTGPVTNVKLFNNGASIYPYFD